MKVAVITIIALSIIGLSGFSAAESPPVLGIVTVDFELVDREGQAVTLDDFRGQNVLLAFGFTHCLHICPMIGANMARAIQATDKGVVGLFISVDTERDSPTITDDYAKRFSEKMIGLGGSHDQIAAAAENFHATFVVTKSESTYTVQHTPSIFLIGPDGNLIDVFAMNAQSENIAAAMR